MRHSRLEIPPGPALIDRSTGREPERRAGVPATRRGRVLRQNSAELNISNIQWSPPCWFMNSVNHWFQKCWPDSRIPIYGMKTEYVLVCDRKRFFCQNPEPRIRVWRKFGQNWNFVLLGNFWTELSFSALTVNFITNMAKSAKKFGQTNMQCFMILSLSIIFGQNGHFQPYGQTAETHKTWWNHSQN